MSLPIKKTREKFLGDGVNKRFAFSFRVFDARNVRVYLYDAAKDDGFLFSVDRDEVTDEVGIEVTDEVGIEAGDRGGEVVFKEAPASGKAVLIERRMPFIQLDRYANGTRFDAAVVERRFDRDCAERQELKEDVRDALEAADECVSRAKEYCDGAEDARDKALEAQKGAEAARDKAEDYRDAAEEARTAAEKAAREAASKAPIYHASALETYGRGTDNLFGHVKLSDSVLSETLTAQDGGTAATPFAVKKARDEAKAAGDKADEARRDISILFKETESYYGGLNLETLFASEIAAAAGSTQERKRWNWIKGRIDKGDFSGIHIGDFLELDVTSAIDTDGANAGESAKDTYQMQILGINTYKGIGYAAAHGSNTTSGLTPVPDHIDFISRHLLNTPVKWNLTDSNGGSGDGAESANSQPFLASRAHRYLIDKILPSIDSEVAKLIVSKAARLETRPLRDPPLTESSGCDYFNMGKLWLPTEFEVFGALIFASTGYAAGDGAQYPFFRAAYNRLKVIPSRYATAATLGYWWLASAAGGDSGSVCCVGRNGYPFKKKASADSCAVPICFRVAAEA